MNNYIESFTLPYLTCKVGYPYDVLVPKNLHRIKLEPITIFYGSNGSGKSTLLNIMARKLGVDMQDKGNDGEFLQYVIDECNFCFNPLWTSSSLPMESRFIRSEEVMHSIVKYRKRNEAIKQHIKETRPDLFEQFFLSTPKSDKKYVWDDDKWIFSAVSAFNDGRSNGEKAFEYFQDNINVDSLTLLDEPENSLAPRLQKQLADMIVNYIRFFNCQFIIATHSPFILSIPGARIYNLDKHPSVVCRWTELENIQAYIELFKGIEL